MSHMSTDPQDVRSEVYLVADLRVDVGQQRVLRADRDINLPNLSFKLLVVLVQAAPNVLSNEVLMARVWPGMIVSPETVNKRVKVLRDALGDDAQEPRYIASVRSRGYRLVVEVARAETITPIGVAPIAVTGDPSLATASLVDAALGPQETAIAPPTHWRRAIPWGVAGVLILAALIGVGIQRRHSEAVAAARHGVLPTDLATTTANARTVAVLPFESISAQASDAYLAQGLPEMILNRLSHVEGLAVIARSSSFALPTKRMDSREIGRRLHSGYLVGGSVQREADRLRVDVHLVDAATGIMVWSERYDRELRDIFDLEDQLSDQLADVLALRTGGGKATAALKERSHNVEAYLAFLKGRTLLGRFTVPESEAAIPYFEKAISLDPQFAAAYASLYDARMQAASGRVCAGSDASAEVGCNWRAASGRALRSSGAALDGFRWYEMGCHYRDRPES